MRRFSILIADEAFDLLADLATRERRDVRDQAAVLLEEATAKAARIGRPWRNGEGYDPLSSLGLLPPAAESSKRLSSACPAEHAKRNPPSTAVIACRRMPTKTAGLRSD